MEYTAPTYDYLVKTVIVGDSGVGKSCLLKRFSDREFISNYISTIGVDFVIRTLDLNGKITKLQIWDTAGQERFRTITNSYYRGANCILIVFDVTDVDSFKNVHNWWREVQMYATDQTQVMLVANKTDLANHRMVTQEQAANLAAELKVPLVETSAKTSSNVDGAFTTIAQQFIDQQHSLKTDTQPKAPEGGSGFSLLDEDSAIKKCCVIM